MAPEVEVVTVAVVTYNSATLIPELATSLEHGLDGVAWQLVVVDNASSDDSVQAVRTHCPGARVIHMGRNAGYAAAVNRAVAGAAPHSAVLVMNPDVRLQPGSVSRLLTELRSRGRASWCPGSWTLAGR